MNEFEESFHEDKQENKKLIEQDNSKNNINITHVTAKTDISHTHNDVPTKKIPHNKLKIGIVVGAVAIVLILAISIPLSLKSNSNNKAFPIPIVPPPIPLPSTSVFYNSYSSVGQIKDDQDTMSGVISTSASYNQQKHLQALQYLQHGLKVSQSEDTHLFNTNPKGIPEGENNKLIQNVSFYFAMPFYTAAYLKMGDADNSRFNIPLDSVRTLPINPKMRLEMLGLQVQQSPFSFSFTDVMDQNNVFVHTQNSSLVFMDKYIQMDFQLSSQRMFGFGERMGDFFLGEGTWTMWSKSQDNQYDDGLGGKQGSSVHPLILIQGKKQGDFFAMYFRNSNAQSPLIKFKKDGGSTLSYITTGGEIEIFFLLHGSPKLLIQFYHTLMGFPQLPPFWAMGWHQASSNVESVADLQDVLTQYQQNNIPLDALWLNKEYMSKDSDFSYDQSSFGGLDTVVESMHQNNQKIVLMVRPGLSADDTSENNKYYTTAQKDNVLLKSLINKDQYNGAVVLDVMDNKTVFLDWNARRAQNIWQSGLKDLYDQIPFDGLWLENNEPTGQCSGECPSKISKVLKEEVEHATGYQWFYSYSDQNSQSTYSLPFLPGFSYGGNLDNQTISLNATDSSGESQYNLHNLNGHLQSKVTHEFLTKSSTKDYKDVDNRPFIMSMSTFTGSGHFASHSLGKNQDSWDDLKYSIPGIMLFNIFGIPHTGADVCGYRGDALYSEELCARWIQLATFYPFARMNQEFETPGVPYGLSGEWKQAAIKAIHYRYQYLRLQYTCLFEISIRGGTCFDPMFFHYPEDLNTYQDVETTFMVSNALKVIPVLTYEGSMTASVSTYFPGGGYWVSMNNYYNKVNYEGTEGDKLQIDSQDYLNVYIRPGAIIPFQDNKDFHIKTTQDLISDGKIQMIVNRDQYGYAEGSLFLDQGLLISEIANEQYEYYRYQFGNNSLNAFFDKGTKGSQPSYTLESVLILHAMEQDDIADTDFACYIDSEFKVTNMTIQYFKDDTTLKLTPDTPLMFSQFTSIHLGTSGRDVNLCSPNTYQYQIVGGVLPDLNQPSVNMELSNVDSVLPNLVLSLQMISPTTVNIKWTFKQLPTGNREPFKVPDMLINPQNLSLGTALSTFVTISDSPFKISVNGLDGTEVLSISELLYDSWLNIIKTSLNTSKGDKFHGILGLGERIHTGSSLFFEDGVYSVFNRDSPSPEETGEAPGNNIYGSHPFYMFKTYTSIWTGVFTNIMSPSDYYVKSDKASGKVDITTVATGGVADLYVIIGYSPKQVVAQYWENIVGNPVLIPAFALGWNQCRWGYHRTQDLQDVVDGYRENNIPLETVWSDIDYLSTYRDFTYDQQRFGELPEFIEMLHQNNMTYIPIMDAGIAIRPWGNYSQYDEGLKQDIYLKLDNETHVGMVWPNQAAYPDWFHPNASSYWQSSLNEFHQQISFDGLWLDMNEVSSFCGFFCSYNVPAHSAKRVKSMLKIVPTGRDLDAQTVSMDAVHSNGAIELDAHSAFGSLEVVASHKFFKDVLKKRTYIIERSSYAGMGKYGSKWLGDNFSRIEYLGYSVTGVMFMNIFGIPLVGADICGFTGIPEDELCARWTVVGSFYPFSRNHNYYYSTNQEPYAYNTTYYEEGQLYSSIMRNAIRNKYHLIKYYYTQLFMMSAFKPTQVTTPFFNALFFEFPDDEEAYKNVQYNIMLGPSLKLSVLTDKLGQNYTDFYFPKGVWCNIFNPLNKCFQSSGEYKNMSSKAFDFYVHLYQGNIVPLQNATKLNINNTQQLTSYPVDFHILGAQNKNLNYFWYAQGSYINDDGLNINIEGNFNAYTVSAYAEENNHAAYRITFTLTKEAYNYKIDDCTAVNMNDYLGDMFIYNTQGVGDIWNVEYVFKNGTSQVMINQAMYEAKSGRIVYYGSRTPTCIASIEYITLNAAF